MASERDPFPMDRQKSAKIYSGTGNIDALSKSYSTRDVDAVDAREAKRMLLLGLAVLVAMVLFGIAFFAVYV